MILQHILEELQVPPAAVIAGDARQTQVWRVAQFRASPREEHGTLFLVADAIGLAEACDVMLAGAGHAFLLPEDLGNRLDPHVRARAKATLVQLAGPIPLDLAARVQRMLDDEASPDVNGGGVDRARQDVVEDLLLGRYQDLRAVLMRARGLGLELQRATTAVVVGFLGFDRYYVQHEHLGEAHFQRLKGRIVGCVRREATQHSRDVTVAAHGDGAVALLGGEPDGLGERLAQALRREFRFVPLAVAAGGEKHGPSGLARSYQEAQLALRLRGRLRLKRRYVAFRDLTGYALLHQLQNAPDLVALLDAEVAPLLEVEYGGRTLLLETMAAYYDAGGSLKRAAAHLKIHPKTLRYRLDRIENVLGPGSLEGDKRLLYHLAARYVLWASA